MQQVPGLVSVVTATYNMAEHIAETMDALFAQTYPHIEFVIIDDGSTDETERVLEPYLRDERVRLIKQTNAGQTVAKNHGIRESRGEFVAFCDADDTWRADKLALQIPRFDDPKVAVVFSDMVFIDEHSEVVDHPHMTRYEGHIVEEMLVDNFVPFSSSVVRKSVLDEMGGFDETLRMSIDYDLWLRIGVKYHFAYVREPLLNYRIWSGQMSHRLGERLDNFFRLLERFLDEHGDTIPQRAQNRAWAHSYVTRGIWHAREGRSGDAFADYRRAARLHPIDVRLWRTWAATLLGRV